VDGVSDNVWSFAVVVVVALVVAYGLGGIAKDMGRQSAMESCMTTGAVDTGPSMDEARNPRYWRCAANPAKANQ
jgi:hypothetical protein